MSGGTRIGIVAGSGIELEPLLDEVECVREFGEFDGLTMPGVAGHGGRFVEGRCGGQRVVLQCGRLHVYEGLPIEIVARPVEVLRELGVGTVLYTNAAGGLRAGMKAGDLMGVSEIGLWPFGGWEGRPVSLTPDFLVDACDVTGRYVWVHGPCYETRAEIRALQALEGDAVGMSTAPEVARCRALGMRAGAVSCITNDCTARAVLTHKEVVDTARRASARLCELIRAALPGLG